MTTTEQSSGRPIVNDETAEIPWRFILLFYWGLLWRNLVITFPLTFVVGFVIGFGGAVADSREAASTAITILNPLIAFTVAMFVLRHRLLADCGGHRLQLVRSE